MAPLTAAARTQDQPLTLVGILCVIGAGAAFTTNDMAVKWLSGDYALHQLMLVRSSIALILTLAILVPLEGGYLNLRSRRWRIHLLRGMTVVVANLTFFTGLASLPLGEATAIFFVAPQMITALSALLLREPVGIRRWAAVSIGLLGVVVMLRPGSDAFQLAALLPLCAAICYAVLQILTRTLGRREKASTMAVYIQLCFIAVSAVFGLVAGDGRFVSPDSNPQVMFLLRAWVWPPLEDVLIMLALGVVSATGGYLMSQAYRLSQAALVAPFEYTALPLAVFWSVLIWGDWPDVLAWIGIVLICGAGLYVFQREVMLRRRAASLRASGSTTASPGADSARAASDRSEP